MKKHIVLRNKFKYLYLAFMMLGAATVMSCGDDDEVKIDTRLLGKNEVLFAPLDPETGKAFDEAAIKKLGVDVKKEIKYQVDQEVKIQIWTQIKAKTIKVYELPKDSLIATLQGGSLKKDKLFGTVWTSTIPKLKIEEGKSKEYRFDITFDDAGTSGFSSNSEFEAQYTVAHFKPIVIKNQFLTFRKNNKDVTELSFSGAPGEAFKAPGIGDAIKFVLKDKNAISLPHGNFDYVGTGDFSVSLWFKSNYDEAEDPVLIANQDWGSSDNVGFTYAYKKGEIRCVISDGTNSKKFWYELPKAKLNDNKWHHLAGTYDRDGNWLTYIDGKLEQTEDMSGIGNLDSKLPIGIGQDGTGKYEDSFDGSIGAVSISNYVLSEEEVKVLAGRGSGAEVHKKDGTVSVLEIVNSGTTLSHERGMVVRSFDGTDDYATINDKGALDFVYENDFSIAFWLKTEEKVKMDPVLIGNQDWESSANKGLTIATQLGEVRSVISDGSKKADKWYEAPKPFLNDNAWHFVVVSFDRDGDMTMYINGKKEETKGMSEVGSFKSGQPLRLGQDGEADYGKWFKGQMGRVAFYDYVLDEAQVLKLFK